MDTQKIESIIIDGYTNGKSNLQIANELKEAGCKKVHGNYFSKWDVSEYANDKLGLRKYKEHKRSCLKKESGSVSPQTTFEVQNIIVEDQDTFVAQNKDDNTDLRFALIDRAVFNKQGQIFTDSLIVAEVFDKRHDHILRDIDSLVKELGQIGQPIFGESSYLNSQNKLQRKFLITKRGFTLLVMGFTGEKALQFKLAYMEKFEEMEEALKAPIVSSSTDPLDMLQMMLNTMRNQSLKVNFLEEKVNLIDSKIDNKLEEITAKANEDLSTFKEPTFDYQLDLFNDHDKDQSEVDRLIKTYAAKKVLNPKVVYRALYSLYQSVKKINLYQRAEKEGLRKLSYITKYNLLPEFYAFVYKHLIENDGSYLKVQEIV